MTGQQDPYETYDAAYLLGALSPTDRAAYEAHLANCAACAESVRDLAPLPGLLARAEPAMVDPSPFDPGSSDAMDVETGMAPEPPGRLREGLVRAVRTRRRRRRAVLGAGVAACVAGCAIVGSVVFASDTRPDREALRPLGESAVTASANLIAADWGTEVDMECSGGHGSGEYVLVAVRRDGREEALASWRATSSEEARISVGTAMRRDDIAAVEVRLGNGKPLLRLDR